MSFELDNELFQACNDNRESVMEEVRSLVMRGASVNTKNENDTALIHLAAQHNEYELTKFLIENGADVNALTSDGWTALHFSAQKGYSQISDLLIKSGVNVDIQGLRYHRTALHYAADQGRVAIVQLIINSGGRTDLKDISGSTALDIAKSKLHQEVVMLLSK
ncbi:MAG: ankyrin repeat domain-containing protein [Pelagibacterales bacterium]|nr:ankyrin repeat domain-containing protein [Pelagibacterales bacterium]